MAEDTNTWDDARVAQVHIAEGLIGIEPDMLPDHLLPEGNRPQKKIIAEAHAAEAMKAAPDQTVENPPNPQEILPESPTRLTGIAMAEFALKGSLIEGVPAYIEQVPGYCLVQPWTENKPGIWAGHANAIRTWQRALESEPFKYSYTDDSGTVHQVHHKLKNPMETLYSSNSAAPTPHDTSIHVTLIPDNRRRDELVLVEQWTDDEGRQAMVLHQDSHYPAANDRRTGTMAYALKAMAAVAAESDMTKGGSQPIDIFGDDASIVTMRNHLVDQGIPKSLIHVRDVSKNASPSRPAGSSEKPSTPPAPGNGS
ncbi:MAG: hypothetical protein IPI58_04130 [Alphaproteobacteria bacterium]|nr:MAG: hypothetical protein IPI58_04130 [Alphaproteobacteria bacterium]